MRVYVVLAAVAIIVLSALPAASYVLSFDDMGVGTVLHEDYWDPHGIYFENFFEVTDQPTNPWVTPRSGNNVALGRPDIHGFEFIRFIFKDMSGSFTVNSTGAYFSTKPGVVLEMVGYGGTQNEMVDSRLIGAEGEAWINEYVEINGSIGAVVFRPITSGALSDFCMDDLTIAPVPEPSSMLAVVGCFVGLVSICRRKAG